MDVNSTWIPTWHRMDRVDWSFGLYSKPSLELHINWWPGHMCLHTTLEGPRPHYMVLEVSCVVVIFSLNEYTSGGGWQTGETIPICSLKIQMCFDEGQEILVEKNSIQFSNSQMTRNIMKWKPLKCLHCSLTNSKKHPYQDAITCSLRDVNDETVDRQQLDGRQFFQMVEVGTEIPRWDHHEVAWMQAKPWMILTRNFCAVLYQMGARCGASLGKCNSRSVHPGIVSLDVHQSRQVSSGDQKSQHRPWGE